MKTNKELVHITNYWIIYKNMKLMDLVYILRYYTVHCLYLQLFYYNNIISINPLTILSMIMTCSIGGLYLTYISPKYLYLEAIMIDVYVDGWLMKLCDILLHHAPLLIFLYIEKNNIKNSNIEMIEMVGLPISYRLLIDPYKIYKISLLNQFLCIFLS